MTAIAEFHQMHSMHQGITPSSSKILPPFLAKSPLKSGNCPSPSLHLFRQFPPIYCFFFGTLPTSPPLKIGFFNQPSIILRFFILNPSQLLKVTEFLVKISQFKLLAMFIKFFVTKYFRLQFIFYEKTATSPEKSHFPLSQQFPSQN